MKPFRKELRLPKYDYTTGWFFVTICTEGRKEILGHVVGGDAHIVPRVEFSEYGRIAEKHLKRILGIDDYVIMPNHIHFVVDVGAQEGSMWASTPTKPLGSLVRSFKTLVSKAAGKTIWQRSYYDHVIRNESDYMRVRQYISDNPACWAEDEYYQEF